MRVSGALQIGDDTEQSLEEGLIANPSPADWSSPPDHTETFYLFFAGTWSNQVQAARYIGGMTMLTTTQQVVHTRLQGTMTMNPRRIWSYPEMPEVVRFPTMLGWFFACFQWYENIASSEKNTVCSPRLAMPVEDGSLTYYEINQSACALGQEMDCETHSKKYESLITLATKAGIPPTSINLILYGVSRGATATFYAAALHHYLQAKLCVLEAPFSSMRALVKHMTGTAFFYNNWMVKWLLGWWLLGRKHQTGKEHQAIEHAKKFPLNLPLIIISSEADELVPHHLALNLALRVAGYRIEAKKSNPTQDIAEVYFLPLKKARHNAYWLSDTEDGKRYQNFMQAIYRHYQLDYFSDELADQGARDMLRYELTKECSVLSQQVGFQHQFKLNKPQRCDIQTQAFAQLQSQIERAPDELEFVKQFCHKMPMYRKSSHQFQRFFKPANGMAHFFTHSMRFLTTSVAELCGWCESHGFASRWLDIFIHCCQCCINNQNSEHRYFNPV